MNKLCPRAHLITTATTSKIINTLAQGTRHFSRAKNGVSPFCEVALTWDNKKWSVCEWRILNRWHSTIYLSPVYELTSKRSMFNEAVAVINFHIQSYYCSAPFRQYFWAFRSRKTVPSIDTQRTSTCNCTKFSNCNSNARVRAERLRGEIHRETLFTSIIYIS